uniref:PI3K/PI4K domain-containing protein n=1 Tax=Angiostrongylus cantonensis TaxID=6313 RepID=A0A0K0DHL0_ANGCA
MNAINLDSKASAASVEAILVLCNDGKFFTPYITLDGFAVELARREYEGMESLSIPFTRILKITTSPSYKESQCQEFGISMDLDEISSRKLAVLYAAALKDDRKKVIFYDLTWIDKPKMTITVLLKGRNAIFDCLKGLQRWWNYPALCGTNTYVTLEFLIFMDVFVDFGAIVMKMMVICRSLIGEWGNFVETVFSLVISCSALHYGLFNTVVYFGLSDDYPLEKPYIAQGPQPGVELVYRLTSTKNNGEEKTGVDF